MQSQNRCILNSESKWDSPKAQQHPAYQLSFWAWPWECFRVTETSLAHSFFSCTLTSAWWLFHGRLLVAFPGNKNPGDRHLPCCPNPCRSQRKWQMHRRSSDAAESSQMFLGWAWSLPEGQLLCWLLPLPGLFSPWPLPAVISFQFFRSQLKIASSRDLLWPLYLHDAPTPHFLFPSLQLFVELFADL